MASKEAGAAAVVLAASSALLVSLAASAAGWHELIAGSDRAQSLADAAAHAAEVAVAASVTGDEVSLAIERDPAACVYAREAGDPFAHLELACAAAVAVARDLLARQAGDTALLEELALGADVRDMRSGTGAGHLTAVAVVRLRRALPGCARAAPPRSGPSLCWARATAAAEQTL